MEAKVRLQMGQHFEFASWISDSLMVGVRMPAGVFPVLIRRDSVDVGVKAVAGVMITPSSPESFNTGGLLPK